MVRDNSLETRLSRVESVVVSIQSGIESIIRRYSKDDRQGICGNKPGGSTKTCESLSANVSYERLKQTASKSNKLTPSTENAGEINKRHVEEKIDVEIYGNSKAKNVGNSATTNDQSGNEITPIDFDNKQYSTDGKIAKTSSKQLNATEICDDKSIDKDDASIKSANIAGMNANAQSSIDSLMDCISSLQTAITDNTSAIRDLAVTQKPRGYYKNWGADHQLFASGRYVPAHVFMAAMHKIPRMIELFNVGRKAIDKILDSLPIYKVSRTTRFPADGAYVNVNDYYVHICIEELRDAAVNCIAMGHCTDEFNKVLKILESFVEYDKPSDIIELSMLYDLNKFEIELQWVDE